MKRTFRILATFLSIALIICALPQSVLAHIGDLLSTFDTESTETGSHDVYVLGEIIEKRTETTKTFHMSDGSFIAADYGKAVHYADENGVWRDYDNTWQFCAASADEDSVAGYGNKAADVRIKLANNSNSSNLLKLTFGDYKVSMHLVDADKSKALELYHAMEKPEGNDIDAASTLHKFSSGAIYKDILPDVDLEYIISGGTVKENIIIKDTADSYIYTFELKLHGLTPSVDPDGNILLQDETTDETQLIIPAGYMYDANGAYSDAVSYNITHQNGKKYTLTVTVDADWVNTDERAFPVTVDPTVDVIAKCKSTEDTYITQNAPTLNSYSRAEVLAGYYGNNTSLECHALVCPTDFPVLPESSVIIDAEIRLMHMTNGTEYGSVTIAAKEIAAQWNSKTVTWNTKPTYGNIIYDYVTVDGSTEGTYISFDVTSLAQKWYNDPATNNGVALVPLYGGGSGRIYFGSSDYKESTAPHLLISYRDTKGIEDHWTYSTQTIGAGTGYVNHYSGSLIYVMDLGLDTGDFPYAAEYVYNSYLAGTEFSAAHKTATMPLYDMSFGNGWQLNFLQTLVNVGTASAPLYVYTDTDGTDHYFEYNAETQKYEDEDGLGYVLNVSGTSLVLTTPEELTVTFTNGIISSVAYEVEDTTKCFNFVYTTSTTGSKLNKIVDESGKTILSLTYSGNVITAVKKSSSKCATFTYNGDSLSSICST
ncbi:MAG: DNRLRE domain-containing protein, partial [Lachnospiraceae bacterium]|nr:DNRLRE domain-containing protein [Lachnospiraceae bacterium]